MANADAFFERRASCRIVLERTRTLVANPKTWVRGEGARNARGHRVRWSDPSAVQFCFMSALNRALALRPGLTQEDVLHELDLTVRSAIVLNDQHGRAAVLDVIDAWLEKYPS